MLKSYNWDGCNWTHLCYEHRSTVLIKYSRTFLTDNGSLHNRQRFVFLFPRRKPMYGLWSLQFTQFNAENLHRHVRVHFWMGLLKRKPPSPPTFPGQIPTHPNIVKIWHAEMLCKSGTTQYCRIWHTYHDYFTRHNFFIPFGSTSCRSNTVQS